MKLRPPRLREVAAIAAVVLTAYALVLVTRADFLDAVNKKRVDKGCHALVATSGDLIDSARQHSREMMDAGYIYHTDPLRIGHWSKVGEIVGHGGDDLEVLFEAFMDSPEHRKIMMDCAYDQAAIGMVRDGGIWFTGRFYSK